jgi:uncharacterized protein (DUF433 family)
VWEIVEAYKMSGECAAALLDATDIAEADLRQAMAYYERYPEEIDRAIQENDQPIDELRRRFPTATFA